jgi:predicted branched-subunit amino acid permease
MSGPQLITGVARAANWALAALLAAAAAASLLTIGVTWLGAAACALFVVLGLGSLWRKPFAYLAVATLAFFSLAAAMQHGNFAIATGNGALFALALYVRSQLRIPRAPTSGAEKSS